MFTTLDTFDTEYSADSVEWCPAQNFQDLFVCGTYQLVPGEDDVSSGVPSSAKKTEQTRLGRIYLLRVTHGGKIHRVQTLNTSAILDMKWARVASRDIAYLGVVNSIGYLQIYSLARGAHDDARLDLLAETRVRQDENDLLALSLDWSGNIPDNIDDRLRVAVSDSRGGVSLYSFDIHEAKYILELQVAKTLHEFEAWITAFNYHCSNTLYSGGDDCKFYRLDVRMGLETTACSRRHGAGVTSIHSNEAKEFSLATGSYDEILRLWDTRNFRTPISETNLHGGVWRLKWDPYDRTKLFAACMYGGFRVIDCRAESSPQILAEYNEHESIAYGCDWSYLDEAFLASRILHEDTKNVALAATCSFYDHTLKISSLELANK